MTDRLTLARAFEDAGIPRDKAEHVADVVFDIVRENTATKADVAASEAKLLHETAAIRGDLGQSETRLRAAIDSMAHSLTVRGLTALVSLFFALLAALHYWPPH